MIDVLCAVAASAPVNGPRNVNITDGLLTRDASSALSFHHRDSFSHVLSNLLVLMKRNCGEKAFSVDFGFCDFESAREPLIHFGKSLSLFASLLIGVAGSDNCKAIAQILRN